MSVSVIVPTYRRPGLLERCLAALAAQRAAPPHELIVVDDASKDSTAAVLQSWAGRLPHLRFVSQPWNRGPAAARNRGVALSEGGIVAFTDDDCEPEPDWLRELDAALGSSSMRTAGVGGRVVAARPGVIGEYMTRNRILEPPESLRYLVTANCAYWKDLVELAGGFDEAIRHPGGEDPGLSMAVHRLGFGLVFAPRAVVRHHFRESLWDFAKTFYRYGKGCRHVVDG